MKAVMFSYVENQSAMPKITGVSFFLTILSTKQLLKNIEGVFNKQNNCWLWPFLWTIYILQLMMGYKQWAINFKWRTNPNSLPYPYPKPQL